MQDLSCDIEHKPKIDLLAAVIAGCVVIYWMTDTFHSACEYPEAVARYAGGPRRNVPGYSSLVPMARPIPLSTLVPWNRALVRRASGACIETQTCLRLLSPLYLTHMIAGFSQPLAAWVVRRTDFGYGLEWQDAQSVNLGQLLDRAAVRQPALARKAVWSHRALAGKDREHVHL